MLDVWENGRKGFGRSERRFVGEEEGLGFFWVRGKGGKVFFLGGKDGGREEEVGFLVRKR